MTQLPFVDAVLGRLIRRPEPLEFPEDLADGSDRNPRPWRCPVGAELGRGARGTDTLHRPLRDERPDRDVRNRRLT